MFEKKKTKPVEKDAITAETLVPVEIPSTPPEEVKELMKEVSKELTVALAKACFINGKQYGPGLTVVPSDAFHIWKPCL